MVPGKLWLCFEINQLLKLLNIGSIIFPTASSSVSHYPSVALPAAGGVGILRYCHTDISWDTTSPQHWLSFPHKQQILLSSLWGLSVSPLPPVRCLDKASVTNICSLVTCQVPHLGLGAGTGRSMMRQSNKKHNYIYLSFIWSASSVTAQPLVRVSK